MKRIISTCILVVALLCLAIVPAYASYYECDTCGASINAYCDGGIANFSESHRYGFLWLNKCEYTVLAHTTTEDCVDGAHSDVGMDVIYGERGHITSDPTVEDVCGTKDTVNPSCPIGSFAYST